MNYDIEIRVHLDESSSWDPARDRFLESLGFGDALLPAETEVWAGGIPDEVEDEEGVVLSSQPDDFNLTAPVNEASAHRGTSLSVRLMLSGSRPEWYSIPAKDDRADSEEVSVAIFPVKGLIIPHADERLHLQCPACDGELVLHRRDFGVEGLCVWCLCPLVATEIAGESHVRVFPLLRRSSSQKEEVSTFALDPPDHPEGSVLTPPAHDLAKAFQMTGFDRPSGQADPSFLPDPEETDYPLSGPANSLKNDLASSFASAGGGFWPPLSPGKGTVEVDPEADWAPDLGRKTAEAHEGNFCEAPKVRKSEPVIRRGIFVLIFVIVGLTIATALASLVMPVGHYVQAARSFMERQVTPLDAERTR